MDLPLKNLTHEEKAYRGKLKGIAYDCATGKLTADAVWRSKGTFEKVAVTAATLPELAEAAKAVIVPAV